MLAICSSRAVCPSIILYIVNSCIDLIRRVSLGPPARVTRVTFRPSSPIISPILGKNNGPKVVGPNMPKRYIPRNLSARPPIRSRLDLEERDEQTLSLPRIIFPAAESKEEAEGVRSQIARAITLASAERIRIRPPPPPQCDRR